MMKFDIDIISSHSTKHALYSYFNARFSDCSYVHDNRLLYSSLIDDMISLEGDYKFSSIKLIR